MRRKKRWIFLALIVLGVIAFVLARREPAVEPGSFLVVDIGGAYAEERPPDLVGQLVGSEEPILAELLLELQKAAVDTRIVGILAKVRPLEVDFATVQELRAALQRLRAAGKRVIVWVTGEGTSGNREYYLASVADRIYYAENSMLPLLGLHATYLFLGGVWDHLHVDMQVEQIREYKTFGDFLSRQSMSEAHREMANAILDSLHEQFVGDIAQSRGMTHQQVQALIDRPVLTPADFQQAGLIDGVQYYTKVLDALATSTGEPVRTIPLSVYRQVKPTSVGLMRGPKLAVVFGVGGVTTGKSSWSATGQLMGSDTMVEAFEHAAKDEDVRAIVFRVDSPGGSALASDLIWHAVMEAKAKKPVVVSMAGVAGSGGYYVAAGATKIVAQPATLTGSIGVVFSLPNVQGLLTTLGVTTESLERGRYARLFDTSKSWSPDERQQVQRLLATVYRTFTDKVATGRGLSVEDVDRLGRGRVWTGVQAQAVGLVDQLGGLETAVQVAKEMAGIPRESSVQLVFYPETKGVVEMLLERLQSRIGTSLRLPAAVRTWFRGLAPLGTLEHGPLVLMPVLTQVQ